MRKIDKYFSIVDYLDILAYFRFLGMKNSSKFDVDDSQTYTLP